MKFFQVPMGAPTKKLAEVSKGLIEEFKKLKSKAQYIIELKEINQYLNETVWDFDQRFKTLMERVNFEMSNIQHKEWFVVAVISHIRLSLMQQKIVKQSEALENAMKIYCYNL